MTELLDTYNQIADLRAQLAQDDREIDNLRNDNEILRDEVISLTFELVNLEREIQRLEFEVSRAQDYE